MKKLSRILSLVIVVGMIAAIPASTQILSGSRGESSDGVNLPMLVLVNRLELSEEQMKALQDLLSDLLEEKETVDALRAEFEDVMIEFNGTGEELDELLATFREEQGALAEALHESVEASLDEVRDLLSINQGIVLREALPELLGGGALIGSDHGIDRRENIVGMMESRMLAQAMGRATMMERMKQAHQGGQPQMQSPMPGGMWMDDRSGSFEQESHRFGDVSMSNMMQERFGSDSMRQMPEERFGQGSDVQSAGTMLEQMRSRLERFGNQIPEELRERMAERFGGVIENLGEYLGRNLGQPGNRSGNAMRGQRGIGEQGNLFDQLEQVAEILQLKLGAME